MIPGALNADGHLPSCNPFCAKRHCPCGNDAQHGVAWCRDCGVAAAGRNVPTLMDGPGVRLALRANRREDLLIRRSARRRA